MCGGSIEYIPCSVVFHMYKDHKFSHREKGLLYLEDRLAETLLDENFKKYYYRIYGDSKDRNYGDITKNLEKLKKANCKSFSWFVKNIQKEIFIPDNVQDKNWLTTTTTTTTIPLPIKTTQKLVEEKKNEMTKKLTKPQKVNLN